MARAFADLYPGPDGARRRYQAWCHTRLDPGIYESFASENEGYDCAALFPQIACPVLLLQAEAMTEHDAERALIQLPDGYAVRFESAGHLLHAGPQRYQVLVTLTHFLESL